MPTTHDGAPWHLCLPASLTGLHSVIATGRIAQSFRSPIRHAAPTAAAATAAAATAATAAADPARHLHELGGGKDAAATVARVQLSESVW